MSRPPRPTGEDDIQAYIDDRLPAERRQAVEAYLAEQPEVAERVASYRGHRDALRERLRPKTPEPVPTRLRVAHIVAERRSRAWRRLRTMAATIAWLVLGAGAGWYANELVARRSLVMTQVADEAFDAYRTFVVEVVHPVEVSAGQEAHLVQWLSKRLGRPIAAPDLRDQGFRLMGGRLLPAGQALAAQFMYEDDKGARLTLYVRAGESRETSFRFASRNGVSAFYWIDGNFGYAVTASTDRDRLLSIARRAYEQIAGAAS
ncbi:MAG: anti-sigma factor family protein [Hyphomicrobiales bacterium]